MTVSAVGLNWSLTGTGGFVLSAIRSSWRRWHRLLRRFLSPSSWIGADPREVV